MEPYDIIINGGPFDTRGYTRKTGDPAADLASVAFPDNQAMAAQWLNEAIAAGRRLAPVTMTFGDIVVLFKRLPD